MVDRIMAGTAGGKLSARGEGGLIYFSQPSRAKGAKAAKDSISSVDDFSEDVRARNRAEGPAVSAVVAVVAQNEILVFAAAEKFVLILFVGISRRAGRQIR